MIENRVYGILSETLDIPTALITPESRLVDLITDSIQLFELIMKFEQELGESVSYEDLANIEVVSDIVTYASVKLTPVRV